MAKNKALSSLAAINGSLIEGSAEDALQEELSVFISFPSAKDPSWEQRYPGKSTCVVITWANYAWFKPFEKGQVKKRGDEYEGLKNEFGRLMLQRMYQMFPQLDGKVEYFNVGSPLSNNYYIGSSEGEMYGLEHSVKRFSPEALIDMRADTDIPGLYLAGQDLMTCGMVGAVYGGVLCASQMTNRFLMFDLFKLTKQMQGH